jgi:hypothetical protein
MGHFFNGLLDGLTFFFKENEQKLRNLRADAPFSGNLNGVRIGDTLSEVVARLGQPSVAPWDFGDNKAYSWRIGGNVFRCDFNKEQKVETMFLMVSDIAR